ncbi:MAG: DUF192 domain-containing protein [Chlorogloeopsis fritschii C42_A2020_084]|uniref:DUF192 domain-containing protein n=1 Tax=Chlorogloeopsis fritschii TaxID=1124 RepID=UPI001A0A36B3|nr:DUF192 domain-containing protein [Chlorogloeopsis fritschii]MBF2008581.1 DUF192 domain-containing protein [Chlorogloeopsis fritschii C42_A2020_084]
MILWQSLLSILLGVMLIGCSAPTPAKPPVTAPGSHNSAPLKFEPLPLLTNSGQQLPISARATVPNGTKIDLEVAQTPAQQAMGLMYRPALPQNRGMLFKFSSPQPVSFWMKNVPVSLDMIFLRQGKIQKIIAAVPPCTADPCPTYGPRTQIDQVIELRSGRAAELGLKEGDRIKIDFLTSGNLRK